MAMNSVITICHNHLDWIRRNPAVFTTGLVSRMEQGEVDPHPGHARWNGDAMPGVQVVSCDHSSQAVVIVAGGNCGKRVASVGSAGPGMPSDVDALKAMARRLGYSVRKNRPKQAPLNVKDKESVVVGTNKNPFNGQESTIMHLKPAPQSKPASKTKRASRKRRGGKRR